MIKYYYYVIMKIERKIIMGNRYIEPIKKNFETIKNPIFSEQSKKQAWENILAGPFPLQKHFSLEVEESKNNETEFMDLNLNKTTMFEDDCVNQIYDFLSSKGFCDIQIAAILGNFRFETASSFNPACNWERLHNPNYASNEYYKQDGTLVYKEADLADLPKEEAIDKIKGLVPKYGGIGFLQWTGGRFDGEKWIPATNGLDRKAKFLNWCNENKYDWMELNVQLEYFYKEYQEWDVSKRKIFEEKTDVIDAATYFCDVFEDPGDASSGTRSQYANEYFQTIVENASQQE